MYLGEKTGRDRLGKEGREEEEEEEEDERRLSSGSSSRNHSRPEMLTRVSENIPL